MRATRAKNNQLPEHAPVPTHGRRRLQLLVPTYHFEDRPDDGSQPVRSPCGHAIGQYRQLCRNFLVRDVVPNGKHDLLSVHFLLREAVQFLLGPALREERTGKDHDPVARIGEPVVDPLAQAVAELQDDPYQTESPAASAFTRDGGFVFGRVGNEH